MNYQVKSILFIIVLTLTFFSCQYFEKSDLEHDNLNGDVMEIIYFSSACGDSAIYKYDNNGNLINSVRFNNNGEIVEITNSDKSVIRSRQYQNQVDMYNDSIKEKINLELEASIKRIKEFNNDSFEHEDTRRFEVKPYRNIESVELGDFCRVIEKKNTDGEVVEKNYYDDVYDKSKFNGDYPVDWIFRLT